MKHRDYEGWVAITLALGLVLGLLALLRRADNLGADATLLATVFGGLIATLGQYLGSRAAKAPPKDDDEGTNGNGKH